MEEPIDNQYFDWLCAKVKMNRGSTYLELLRILYRFEFLIVHPLDENRVLDALELRDEFKHITNIDLTKELFQEEVSVLEVLIAFSERASFQIDMTPKEWFWQFITNLNLEEFQHPNLKDQERILDILHRFVTRNYLSNGDGGLFPLRRPKHDQREVEIWYQFCEYVDDNGLLYELT